MTDLSLVNKVKRPKGRPPEWMTVGQAAEKKGVARRTILAAIERGKLPAAKLGEGTMARWIIRIKDVEEWTPSPSGRPRKETRDDG